jgi:hypothetical protein
LGQTNRRASAWPALAVVLIVSFSALPMIWPWRVSSSRCARAGYHFDYLDKTNGTPFACCWPSQI